MSWDIVLFNSDEKIISVEELNEELLVPTNFCKSFETHFKDIKKDEDHREIIGQDFAIDYFIDDEDVSNKMISLYGENALYAIIELAKKQNWQIFDTGLGEMIDLENPSKNGYQNFQAYLNHVLNSRK